MQKNNNNTSSDNFIMSPKVDFCFLELMKNPRVRHGFIGTILGIDPEDISSSELLTPLLDRDSADDKLGILDVLVKLFNGIRINMEMQVSAFPNWTERALFYLTKMFSGQIKKGDDYSVLEKCIHVSILDFIHFPGDEVCYRTIHLRQDHSNELYSEKLEMQILELQKLPPEAKSEDGILKWMRFFHATHREEFQHMAEQDKYIKEAYNELLRLSGDESKRSEYEAREKSLRDYIWQLKCAKEEGMKEGRESERTHLRLLTAALQASGRLDEFPAALQDPDKLAELYAEFEISEN